MPYHCSELHSLLSNCRINFDIIWITESRLKRNQKALQNIDIPNYNIEHCPTEADFLDQMYSASLAPHITSPTRITSHSRTLIDNIFSTDISENAISGNIVTSISDHLAQFLFLSIDQFKTNNNKNIYQRKFKSFNQNLNWNNVLELEKKKMLITHLINFS